MILLDLIANLVIEEKGGEMTVATMKRLDKAQEQTHMAEKQLDEAMEKYVASRQVSLDALRNHNEKG